MSTDQHEKAGWTAKTFASFVLLCKATIKKIMEVVISLSEIISSCSPDPASQI